MTGSSAVCHFCMLLLCLFASGSQSSGRGAAGRVAAPEYIVNPDGGELEVPVGVKTLQVQEKFSETFFLSIIF